jgi:hypothetical protein
VGNIWEEVAENCIMRSVVLYTKYRLGVGAGRKCSMHGRDEKAFTKYDQKF